jgi:hypothetical protein
MSNYINIDNQNTLNETLCISNTDNDLKQLIEYWLNQKNEYLRNLQNGVGHIQSIRCIIDKIDIKLATLSKLCK